MWPNSRSGFLRAQASKHMVPALPATTRADSRDLLECSSIGTISTFAILLISLKNQIGLGRRRPYWSGCSLTLKIHPLGRMLAIALTASFCSTNIPARGDVLSYG